MTLEEDFEDCEKTYRKETGHSTSRVDEMVKRYGLKAAIEGLIIKGFDSSGLKTCKKHGILDKSFESLVLRYPKEFPVAVRVAADFNLKHV
ncbi:hypothetical protein AGMMS49944_27420 [Spirochaetia bacterium]|nr:hypothetical protein AGMMS49944_27420 [Spirochaetia bacterium]